MSGQKNGGILFGLVLAVSLVSSALAVMLTVQYDSRVQFEQLSVVCAEILAREPKAETAVLGALKAYTRDDGMVAETGGVLSAFGYRGADFRKKTDWNYYLRAAAGWLSGGLLFAATFLYRNQKERKRIQALAVYLEQVNMGKAAIYSVAGEDDFAKLEDEIYKTVTFLEQTKDTAVQARNDFARNLSNIAHQIKTPITAMSLSVQMMAGVCAEDQGLCGGRQQKVYEKEKRYLEQMQKQLLRLTRLEEALLVLSRIDAGRLLLQQKEVDVYTLLVLAADNLQELLGGKNTAIDIPECGEMTITVDLDWTMEAVINLMKNSLEHSEGGTVYCSYAQNPLYTEILIWDEGEGFARADLPHLFERFYRGQNAREGGIGIGLSLAKEIVERQNGTIRAENRLEGGACFRVRFYHT